MFTLDTSKAFFIWFSKETFLNIQNQFRLVGIKTKNPSLEITMIYSRELLSKEARESMDTFLAKHNIKAKAVEDLYTEHAKHYSEYEKVLIEFVKIELQKWATNTGGNPAGASDILRTLSPILADYGFYFQLSSSLALENQPRYKQIKTPLVCWASQDNRNNTAINNNFLGVASNQQTRDLHTTAKKMLTCIHKALISQYEKPLSSELFQNQNPRDAESLMFNGLLQSVIQKNKKTTIFDFRHTLEMFSQKSFFELSRFLKQENMLMQIMNQQWNEKLKKCKTESKELSIFFKVDRKSLGDLELLSPSLIAQLHGVFLLSHATRSNEFEHVIRTNGNIPEFLEKISRNEIEKIQFNFYKRTVECISGPVVLRNFLAKYQQKGTALIAFGLSNNNLEEQILISTNTMEEKETAEADLSWTQQGMGKVKSHEARMVAAASTITTVYRHYRELRSQKLKAITAH